MAATADFPREFGEPRVRKIPLVPAPYEGVMLTRQWAYWHKPGDEEHMTANGHTSWLPSLVKHHTMNMMLEASEYGWEADIFHDLFGQIRDDPRLRIILWFDNIRKCIPDATIALRPYSDDEIKEGFYCKVPNCTEDHTPKQPHKSLSRERMLLQLEEEQCGLIVDGVWGTAVMAFPFAVYEAKKSTRQDILYAQDQVNHAAQTYLAMIDDLARDPEDPSKYQTPESTKFQMFCFTSEGPNWNVHVAFEFLAQNVELLWSGDVTNYTDAFDLICLVDQIHNFGVTQHRDFVIKHLEPWLAKGERWNAERERHRQQQRASGLKPWKLDRPPWAGWHKLKMDCEDAKKKRKYATLRKAMEAQVEEDGGSGEDAAEEVLVSPPPAKRRGRPKRKRVIEENQGGNNASGSRKRKRCAIEPIPGPEGANISALPIETSALRRSGRNKAKA